jgi:hypothetical protein
MRIPARGSRIFGEWSLPTATSDVAIKIPLLRSLSESASLTTM